MKSSTAIVKAHIGDAIQKLLLGECGELHSRLDEIAVDLEMLGTKAKGHFYSVKLDGNCRPRTNDLIDFVFNKIVDYSIPKKDFDAAKDHLDTTGSASKIVELEQRARTLFTHLSNTGEGGELLLYVLAQDVLRLPQLISKMSLKTSGELHYQGADGIHVKYEASDDKLALYWCESKMYKDLASGIRECFESLKGFLLDAYGYKSTQARDLQLITDNISANVNNPALEELLVRYFDLDDDLSNSLVYKGICFVGFDSGHYPTAPLSQTADRVKELFENEVDSWTTRVCGGISNHTSLDKFEIHVFLIPFPSVQEFRDYLLKKIA